jgi:signal transduction histidine kinase
LRDEVRGRPRDGAGEGAGKGQDALPRVARILVLQPPDRGSRLARSLAGLAGHASVEIVHGADACLDRCSAGGVDALLLDARLPRESERVLGARRRVGPPAVVFGAARGATAALRWFRAGASECVAEGDPEDRVAAALAALLEPHSASVAPEPNAARDALDLQTAKLASIGQLAAGVAHEINNPMGFIHANLFQMAEYVADLRQVWSHVDRLQRALRGGVADEVAEASRALAGASEEADVQFVLADLAKAIRESQEGSERIRHIVQDLRDFSHQDTGERVLADLNQCLDSTANIVWPMMKHLVVLEKRYAELPPVSCYPMQLKQVFMNLLVNAYQAIEEAVGSSGASGTITLTTAVEGDHVVVSIRDTGAGIAPEHQGRIFDPFFTTKNVGAGTGLGLSTSFGIVQRHGGTLGFESRPGGGSVFRLSLPLAEEVAG